MPDNRANCFPPADDAFALSIQGRKRVHNADEPQGGDVAKRVCQRLRKSSSKNQLWLWRFYFLLKRPLAFKFHPHERLVDNPIHRKIV
jgi:hypothetical protein